MRNAFSPSLASRAMTGQDGPGVNHRDGTVKVIMSARPEAADGAPEVGGAVGGRAVFRHSAMTTGFVAGTALLLLLMALVWSQPSGGNVVGTAVLAAGMWFIWAAGWWTRVVVSEQGVYVDNVFLQRVIRWNMLPASQSMAVSLRRCLAARRCQWCHSGDRLPER
jgi:hypothetical protein